MVLVALLEAAQDGDRVLDRRLADEADKSQAARTLRDMGVTRDKILSVLAQIRGNQRVTDPNPEGKYAALERYGRDLTELARKNKLDPVIGRDDEIRRGISCRRRARRGRAR